MNVIRILKTFSGLVCFVLYSCNGAGSVNDKTDSVQHDSTASLVVPDSVHYEIPKELKYDPKDYKQENDPFKLIAVGHFYPIGWSKEGLFAYAQMMADTLPGSKDQRYEIQIRNVINNSIVWLITEKIPGSVFVDKDMIGTYISPIDSIWKAHYPEIAAALWQNKIIQHETTEMKNLSFYLKDDLSLYEDPSIKMSWHSDKYQYWADVNLLIKSRKLQKEKVVYIRHFGVNGPMWLTGAGYLQDPYSNRMVLLVELYFWGGYNGGLQLPMYDIAGVDPTVL
ncbi:MAG: hypothetical protein ABIS12_03265 [Bacteroidia bacterium]